MQYLGCPNGGIDGRQPFDYRFLHYWNNDVNLLCFICLVYNLIVKMSKCNTLKDAKQPVAAYLRAQCYFDHLLLQHILTPDKILVIFSSIFNSWHNLNHLLQHIKTSNLNLVLQHIWTPDVIIHDLVRFNKPEILNQV